MFRDEILTGRLVRVVFCVLKAAELPGRKMELSMVSPEFMPH